MLDVHAIYSFFNVIHETGCKPFIVANPSEYVSEDVGRRI